MLLTAWMVSHSAYAQTPDWSKGVSIPEDGRSNPYGLSAQELQQDIRLGRKDALNYPVEITGLMLPYHAVENFLRADSSNPIKRLLQKFMTRITSYRSLDDVERWLGLLQFPSQEGTGAYFIPLDDQNGHRMGFTLKDTALGEGFTVSCAQCHASNLFGQPVLGLTNRFPRANAFFVRGLQAFATVPPWSFQWASDATDAETEMYRRSRQNARFIAAKTPAQLGLDTSLAQVALSLDLRDSDAWATMSQPHAKPDPIASLVSDSKPAVWWNVKYKDRFLSDGSVVSGNPIYTNFLWNEIGRGTDLHRLDDWFARNKETIRQLTTAVFASEAPKFTDFFSADLLSEPRAKHGEQVFLARCARCHGVYQKRWSLPGAENLTWTERLQTVHVRYPSPTPVINVGTDPQRYLGMRSLLQLNRLEISKRQNIVIEPQTGYVPPPLVGIWARWPYFHNNSAPSLCAVLTRADQRPQTYWAREANDRDRDFDSVCNGYPSTRPENASAGLLFDTRREGLSHRGHDEGIFLKEGRELLSDQDKEDLIVFLQTL